MGDGLRLYFAIGASVMAAGGVSMADSPPASVFPVADVRLLPGPFRDAQETDRAYLLRLEPDRLLSHMNRVAGRKAAANYGGWDGGGAGSVGHYLTAISYMAQATGDRELRRRVTCICREMSAIQMANGDGALYASDWEKGYFQRLAQGDVPKVAVAPWYTTHKTLAGLRDAWLLCGESLARETLVKLADWCLNVTARLTSEQWQDMLAAEHGGPHEVLADVYAITGNRKYLDAAARFRHEAVFAPLVRGDGSVLDNLHANTQVPKFIGYERISALGGEAAFHNAAAVFWKEVTYRRSWANGGNSQWERFFPSANFAREVNEVCGPETCNTYNMLKLAQALFARQPSVAAADYCERALYNHILSSQQPDVGGFVYYTSMRPGHYRVYSTDFDSFWCCVGTGMENHAKYGEFIYAREKDRLYVNLFAASVLTWREMGITLRQETKFPDAQTSILELTLKKPRRFTLSIRCPAWTAPDGPRITLNGKPLSVTAKPGTFASITRTWKTGDTVRIALPMALRVEELPGDATRAALLYGPILLGAPMASADLEPADFRAHGAGMTQLARKALPLRDAPVLVGARGTLASRIRKEPGPLRFHTVGVGKPADFPLVPFYRIHNRRYAVYFPLVPPHDYPAYLAGLEAQEREEADLETRTLDRVRPGEQQSEADHALASELSSTGGAQFPHTYWRDARGWFEYAVAVGTDDPVSLRCVWWGSDAGRTFDILVDGRELTTVRLTGEAPGEYVVKSYDVPREWTQGKDRVRIRFRAHEGSVAGGLFELRVVRPPG